MIRRRAAAAFAIALGAVLGVSACTKKDSLILLELRASGPLGAPVVRIRLSAKGWKTKTQDGTLDAAGFRIGYYGPGDGKAVSVTAEVIDAADCVLGSGEATVPKLEAGETSAPTTLFVRPRPENGCVVDAGTPDSGEDAPGQDSGQDGGEDASEDAPSDIGADVPSETGTDDGRVDTGEVDAGTDASAFDAGDDGATLDAGTD
jgi:hypothetical protein